MKLRMTGEEQRSEQKDDGSCRMEIRDKCLALFWYLFQILEKLTELLNLLCFKLNRL